MICDDLKHQSGITLLPFVDVLQGRGIEAVVDVQAVHRPHTAWKSSRSIQGSDILDFFRSFWHVNPFIYHLKSVRWGGRPDWGGGRVGITEGGCGWVWVGGRGSRWCEWCGWVGGCGWVGVGMGSYSSMRWVRAGWCGQGSSDVPSRTNKISRTCERTLDAPAYFLSE